VALVVWGAGWWLSRWLVVVLGAARSARPARRNAPRRGLRRWLWVSRALESQDVGISRGGWLHVALTAGGWLRENKSAVVVARCFYLFLFALS